jgi:hypothetical protein
MSNGKDSRGRAGAAVGGGPGEVGGARGGPAGDGNQSTAASGDSTPSTSAFGKASCSWPKFPMEMWRRRKRHSLTPESYESDLRSRGALWNPGHLGRRPAHRRRCETSDRIAIRGRASASRVGVA